MRKLMMTVVAVLMSMSLAGAYAADDMKKGESKKSEQGQARHCRGA